MQALQGLKVLELGQLIAGPFAGKTLAEFGADVIKVEPAGDGDPLRKWRMLRDGTSVWWQVQSRNKRSVCLDLRTREGQDAARALAAEADVLIENFKPGTMEDWGLGWDALHARNPRLVLASITGYGQHGAFAQRAGHDINYIGLAGVLGQIGAGDGQLALPNFQIADLLGGTLAATSALLAALLGAQRTGVGRHVDISMTREVWRHAVIARAEGEAFRAATGASPPPGASLLNGGSACYGVYRTADDRHLAVGALEPKFWQAFCKAIGQPAWVERHWSTGELPGSAAARATRQAVAEWLATKSMADWLELTDPADCCVTPVLRLEEVEAHAWFREA